MGRSPGWTDKASRRFARRSLVVGALSVGLVGAGWTNVSIPQSLAAGSDPMCSFTTYHSGLGGWDHRWHACDADRERAESGHTGAVRRGAR